MKKSTILKCIFICVGIAVTILAFELNVNASLKETIIKTNATPITNRVIILDAGHRSAR